MPKESARTPYRRMEEESTWLRGVEKQTAKNRIHALTFPEKAEKPEKKKERNICASWLTKTLAHKLALLLWNELWREQRDFLG